MSDIYNFDGKSAKEVREDLFVLSNMKLYNVIRVSQTDEDYTIIPVVAQKSLKKFLKKIQKYKIIENLRIDIDYDIEKDIEFYDIYIGQKLPQIAKLMSKEYTYDISLRIKRNGGAIGIVWELVSIEMNNNFDIENSKKEDAEDEENEEYANLLNINDIRVYEGDAMERELENVIDELIVWETKYNEASKNVARLSARRDELIKYVD